MFGHDDASVNTKKYLGGQRQQCVTFWHFLIELLMNCSDPCRHAGTDSAGARDKVLKEKVKK